MTDPATAEYDVAIIGLGPVGATLANLLGQLGVRTVVLERDAEINIMPRAVAFDDEVMRIFQAMGLSEEMQRITEVGAGAKFVDRAGKTLVHWQRPMERTENGWYLNYRFNQPELERTLRDATRRYDCVELRLGSEATQLNDTGTGVDVSYRQAHQTKHLMASYVVGCDGGRSFTRAQIGAGFEDLGFHEEWLIVDLLLPEAEADPDRFTYHYCGTERMGSKVFVGSSRKRWEFRLNDDDDCATVQTPEVIWDILKPWINSAEATLERTALYTFHSTIADKWHEGCIFIAGDAAHQTPPFMAQGMCAGIRDAANLAWKLDRVLRGLSPEGLLDTYEAEREPHVREYINLTIEFGKVINSTAMAITRGNPTQSGGAQTVAQLRPRLGPGIIAGDQLHRGRLVPQFSLADGRLLDDATGYRPTVLLADGRTDRLASALRCELRAAGVETVDNPGPELAAWCADKGVVAVLLSPDWNIVGTVSDLGRIEELSPSNWRCG